MAKGLLLRRLTSRLIERWGSRLFQEQAYYGAGAFDGLMTLLRDWGTMNLPEILGPAIAYAQNGFPISARVCATISGLSELFTRHWPTSAAIYLPGGSVPKPLSCFKISPLLTFCNA